MWDKLCKCNRCGDKFFPEVDDDSETISVTLCYDCLENAIEEYEERRRERIARENHAYPVDTHTYIC